MHPIYFDFVFALISVVLGALMFISRMSIGARCVNSPFLYIAIICLGSFSWVVFGFLAVSAGLDYGGYHTVGYRGHWGYTLGRSFGFITWIMVLYAIYSSFSKRDKLTITPTP